MNRNITEPYGLGLAARPPGRVLPPLHPRRVRALPAADDARSRTSCSSRARAAAAGSTRACSPSRRRPGRATTPTPSSACAIQWGTSLAYPLSSMGAHVSAVPNHQTGRITPLATRAAVAFFGVFGYELDPTALTADERAEVAAQVAFYERHRETFQRGRFLRLESPFEGDRDQVAWMARRARRRDARSSASTGSSTGPSPEAGTSAPARPRPGRGLSGHRAGRSTRRSRSSAPNVGERTGARADGGRPARSTRAPRRGDAAATSGRACSSSSGSAEPPAAGRSSPSSSPASGR